MKKIALAVLITAVLLAGCYERRTNFDLDSDSYQDSNFISEEQNQEKYGTITFNIAFGDPNDVRRGRTIGDILPLISRAQEKKVSYIRGYLFSVHESHYYSFHIDKNDQNGNVRVKVGEYNIYAHAYGVIENNTYNLFNGDRKFEVKKGPDNECPMTLLLNVDQPIVIDLPKDETISECTEINYERINIEYSSDFCPSPDGRRISGAVPINIEEITLLFKDRIYNLDSDIIDALLFDEIIVLDEYDSEPATFIKMEFEPEGNKLIIGSTQNIVLMFKIKAMEDNAITSFQFGLEGEDSDVNEIVLVQKDSGGDIELGRSLFENNISTINPPSSVEILNGEEITFILEACIPASATPDSLISFKLNCIDLAGPFEIKQVNPEFTIVLNGSLIVEAVYKLNSRIVLAGSTENHFLSLRFLANNESVDLESLTVNVIDGGYCDEVEGNYMDIHTVIIYDGSDNKKIAEAFIPSTGEYTFNFPSETIITPRTIKKYLYIRPSMAIIDPAADDAPGTANADVKIRISDIKARGLSSGRSVDIIGENLESNAMILRNSIPYISAPTSYDSLGAATSLTNGNIIIHVTKLNADSSGGNVLTYKLTYEVYTNAEISDPYIEDQYGNIVSEGKWIFSDGKHTASFYLDNPNFESGLEKEVIEVPSGQGRAFYLHVIASGVSAGSYLSTRLIVDNECAPMDTAENIEKSNSFVWSDNHKELSISNGDVINAKQWYNGHLLWAPPAYAISY